MPRPRPLPAALLGQAFRVDDGERAGASRRRQRAGDLSAPFHGVRLHGGDPSDHRIRCRAYSQTAGLDVVLCRESAARCYGFPLPRHLQRSETVHVLKLDGARAPRGRGVAGHRSSRSLQVIRHDGIRMTDPAHTWFDLAAVLGHDDLVIAGDFLVGREPLVPLAELADRVAAHVRVRGARRIREAFGEVRPGARSPRETRLRLALTRAGLPEPAMNAPILLPGYGTAHGDLVYAEALLVLEYEGEHHLTDPEQWAADLRRFNAYAASGWTAIRVTKAMDAAEVVSLARRAFARAARGRDAP
jgi:hypothetical protein